MESLRLTKLKYVSSCYANEEYETCTYSFKNLNQRLNELLDRNNWDKNLFTFSITDGYFEIYYPLEETDEEFDRRINKEKYLKLQRRNQYEQLKKEFENEK